MQLSGNSVSNADIRQRETPVLWPPVFWENRRDWGEGTNVSVYLEKLVSFQWGRPVTSTGWRALHESRLETIFALVFGDCCRLVTGDALGPSCGVPEAEWGGVCKEGVRCAPSATNRGTRMRAVFPVSSVPSWNTLPPRASSWVRMLAQRGYRCVTVNGGWERKSGLPAPHVTWF